MNKKYDTIRRITTTGEKSEMREAGEYLERNGYRFTSVQPKVIARGRRDFSKFRMIGEKRVRADGNLYEETKMMKGLDNNLVKSLKLENEKWKFGDGPIDVKTRSGAIYQVTSNGKISGGSLKIKDAELWGAVYRLGGPIRLDHVVIGLNMEVKADGRMMTTTSVVEIARVNV